MSETRAPYTWGHVNTEYTARQNMLLAQMWEWSEAAACKGDPIFEEKGTAAEKEQKKVCAWCEVRPECLDYALAFPEPDLVWGGHNPKERSALRKGRFLFR